MKTLRDVMPPEMLLYEGNAAKHADVEVVSTLARPAAARVLLGGIAQRQGGWLERKPKPRLVIPRGEPHQTKGDVMSREVRKVPKDWVHPKRPDGSYVPLFDGADSRGYTGNNNEDDESNDDDNGRRAPSACMPDWPDAERTHFMMYECTTEGTPISPVFATAPDLAHWLADNGASLWAGSTGTYKHWLHICQGHGTPGAVFRNGDFDADATVGLR